MTAESEVKQKARFCTLSIDRMCLATCADCPSVLGDPFSYRGKVEPKATDLSPVKPIRVDHSEKDKKPVV